MEQPSSSRPPDRTKFVVVGVAVALIAVIAWLVWAPRSVSTPATVASPSMPVSAAPLSATKASPTIAVPTEPGARPASSAPPTTSPSGAAPAVATMGAMAPSATTTNSGVAIQDGKTIDFSSGKPVLKDSPEEKARIAEAVKDMEAAAKEISFGPSPKQAAPAKK